jgi:intracellular multiplication protein IcmP
MNPVPPREKEDPIVGIAIAGGVVGLLLCLVWWQFHGEIVYWTLRLNWTLLGALDWSWLPRVTATRHAIAQLAAQSPGVGPGVLWAALQQSGVWLSPVVVGCAALLARKVWRHTSNHVHRAITPDRLAWIMAKHAPAIIPMLYAPNLLCSDPPEHRPMLSPDEWALRHKLVVNERLDRDKAQALLVAQLGRRVASLQDLQPHERALFAVFGARLLSDGKDLALAQALLDRLNYSCHTGTFRGMRGYPDLALAEEAFARYAALPGASQWLATHGYVSTLLHAMHLEAIKLGKLPSSHFRWLKGIDRPLWAALNTTGRKTPWIESLAVFTQARWETYLDQMIGIQLTEPHLSDALTALETYLAKVGLIPTPKKTKPA